MTPEGIYPGSLNRTRAMRNVDLKTLRKQAMKDESYSNGYSNSNSMSRGPSSLVDVMARNKKIVEESLPGLFFMVTGAFIAVLGLIHLLMSWWHLYGCGLWTGLLVSMS